MSKEKIKVWILVMALGQACCLSDATAAGSSEFAEPATSITSETSNEADDLLAHIADLSLQLFVVQGSAKLQVVEALSALDDKSLIPTFVLAMRLTGSNIYVAKGLSQLTGEAITNWHEAYEWQERHPEIIPHPTYRSLKLRFLGNTDKRFLTLLDPPPGKNANMRIRLEEIVWGGVLFDGIPSLDNPSMLAADAANYLRETDLVFGIEINGDARAYPLRIMGWHEMVNDVIGGVPVALTYCTLCGTGILYDTLLGDDQQPVVFGSSGLLYRSNKLMFDRKTNSLWNQFSGEPVVGPLANSGIKLNVRPMTITSWSAWRTRYADTKVLSLQTGYTRNYDSGVAYRDYFASTDLMFPAFVKDELLKRRKEYIFGVRSVAASKAWPLQLFGKKPLLNDRVGGQSLVLLGNASTRTVRAYERNADETFALAADGTINTDTASWEVTENYLVSSDGGQQRGRLPGHISYWFAWENFMGVQSELYQP